MKKHTNMNIDINYIDYVKDQGSFIGSLYIGKQLFHYCLKNGKVSLDPIVEGIRISGLPKNDLKLARKMRADGSMEKAEQEVLAQLLIDSMRGDKYWGRRPVSNE